MTTKSDVKPETTPEPAEAAAQTAPPARKVRAPKPKPLDEAFPGGRYIRGGKTDEDGVHWGGQIVDANGKILASFGDDEENTGAATDGKQPEPPK